jgi:hypothetical protein
MEGFHICAVPMARLIICDCRIGGPENLDGTYAKGVGDKYYHQFPILNSPKLSDLSVALTIDSPSVPISDHAIRSCQSVICPLTLQIWHAMSAPHILAAHTRPSRRIVVNSEHSLRYPFVTGL